MTQFINCGGGPDQSAFEMQQLLNAPQEVGAPSISAPTSKLEVNGSDLLELAGDCYIPSDSWYDIEFQIFQVPQRSSPPIPISQSVSCISAPRSSTNCYVRNKIKCENGRYYASIEITNSVVIGQSYLVQGQLVLKKEGQEVRDPKYQFTSRLVVIKK